MRVRFLDVIFPGHPNWWGAMPVFTFLEEYDFSGKTISTFLHARREWAWPECHGCLENVPAVNRPGWPGGPRQQREKMRRMMYPGGWANVGGKSKCYYPTYTENTVD